MNAWDESRDFLIIGSGAGAVVAALVAKESGKRPLIVEKQACFGGSTAHSGGVWWVPNNPLMARDGIPDSYERARQYLDGVVGEFSRGSSPARREAFLKSAPEAVSFLQRYGMQFQRVEYWPDYYDELPGAEKTSRSLVAPLFDISELGDWRDRIAVPPGVDAPVNVDEIPALMLLKRSWSGKSIVLKLLWRQARDKLTGSRTRGMGRAIQGRLLQIALREGIPIWLSSAADELIVENDSVVGVRLTREGRSIRVRATSGVLLNVGGFARNLAMREEFQPSPASVEWTSANPGDTGELIEAAIELGAAVECMDEAWWIATSMGIDGNASAADGQRMQHHIDLGKPHLILVDQDGRRFANESGSYMEIGQRLYRNQKERGKSVPSWAIFDSRHRNSYFWGPVMPGKPPKEWLDSGYVTQSDTLEGLASLCDIDIGGLGETVERFNRFAAEGVDEDFGRGKREFDRRNGDPKVKPNPTLGPLDSPPFYAVRIYPGDVGTAGGLVTDDSARVLRTDGSEIPGLYATGNTTSTVFGRSYPGAGSSISGSLTFAYLAASHACGKGNQ